jgi:hypothetical protein
MLPWLKRKLLALLGVTLKGGNAILKSLSFIPGTEAIKEFKDATEYGLKLGEMAAESMDTQATSNY